jgi:hypothetical protein
MEMKATSPDGSKLSEKLSEERKSIDLQHLKETMEFEERRRAAISKEQASKQPEAPR